jgi:predicted NAD/FAD-binding protein
MRLSRFHFAAPDMFLKPMTAAVWSTSPDKCSLGFPAKTLVRSYHKAASMLQIEQW